MRASPRYPLPALFAHVPVLPPSVRKLGQGTYGTVYLCRQISSGKQCVMKRMLLSTLNGKERQSAFQVATRTDAAHPPTCVAVQVLAALLISFCSHRRRHSSCSSCLTRMWWRTSIRSPQRQSSTSSCRYVHPVSCLFENRKLLLLVPCSNCIAHLQHPYLHAVLRWRRPRAHAASGEEGAADDTRGTGVPAVHSITSYTELLLGGPA